MLPRLYVALVTLSNHFFFFFFFFGGGGGWYTSKSRPLKRADGGPILCAGWVTLRRSSKSTRNAYKCLAPGGTHYTSVGSGVPIKGGLFQIMSGTWIWGWGVTENLGRIKMSRDMRFPTMWYVQQAKAQISLRIRAV